MLSLNDVQKQLTAPPKWLSYETSLTLFALVAFLVGLWWYISPKEGFVGGGTSRCPNLLVQKDGKLMLVNTRLARVPGVNPIQFDHLDDYVQFLEWQRAAGVRCPVLHLQHTYAADGTRTYTVRPGVTEPPVPLKQTSSPSADLPSSPSSPSPPSPSPDDDPEKFLLFSDDHLITHALVEPGDSSHSLAKQGDSLATVDPNGASSATSLPYSSPL